MFGDKHRVNIIVDRALHALAAEYIREHQIPGGLSGYLNMALGNLVKEIYDSGWRPKGRKTPAGLYGRAVAAMEGKHIR